MNREAIRQAFAGPIASIRTPFNRDGSIDYAGLRRCVDFDIQAGAGALLITWGDSLFSLLSDRDIGELTRAVVEHAAGRVAVAACTGRWATPQAVEFAAYCREIGADILQVFLPMWYPACLNERTTVEHHQAIAAHIPVMANSAEIQRNGAAEGLAIARALIERQVNVPAMKADVTGEYDRTMTSLVSEHLTIFAGGQKSFHMELWPYGCQGYLSTFVTFKPEVTRAYRRAVESGDMTAAAWIIEEIDRPFFTHIISSPGGFDAALHGILELCGLAQRWRRPPFYSLNDVEMEALGEFLANLPEVDQ
jgi:dihydrodipicolinate synthase/N-acetylneuraminate lyase